MGDFKGHASRSIVGFLGVHGGHSIGQRNEEGRMLLEFCNAKNFCIVSTWLRMTDKKKITYGSECSESEIDICIMAKVDRIFFYVKVITGELQNNLVIVDVDMKKKEKSVEA